MRLQRLLSLSALLGSLALSSQTAQAQYGTGTPTDDNQPANFTAFRFGGDLGYANIERENFLVFNGTGMMRISPYFRANFWVPLRFNLNQGFALRAGDWDEPRDFARLGQCVRLDLGNFTHAPDRYDPTCEEYEWRGHGIHERTYFNARVAPIRDLTLGNGSLVYAYRNSFDPDHPQLGVQSNFDLRDWGNVRLFLDDVTNPRILGGRVSFRPQQIFLGQNWDETPDDGEIGFTTVTDLYAPIQVQSAFGRPLTDRVGNLRYNTTQLTAIGADLHYMYLWGLGSNSPQRAGLFVFADFNQFIGIEDANALHAGARFVFRDRATGWQVRAGAEYRFQGNRYLPEYFDTNYNVQSQQFALNRETQQILGPQGSTMTKLEYLLSRPAGRSHGFQAYFQLVIPVPTTANGPPSPLPITAFVEDAEGPANASASFLVGPFLMDQLHVAALYQRRNFESLAGIFSLDGTLIRVLGRIYLASSNNPSTANSWLRNLAINLQFDRRYFLQQDGLFSATNDFQATIGYTAGIN